MRLSTPDAPPSLAKRIAAMWELSARKLRAIERSYDESRGSPVFTVSGQWTSRGWTEWTQGFQYGSALLQFDAAGEPEFLRSGREKTHARMAPHLTHVGVHDHGFNNVSTYGGLLRMMNEGRIPEDPGERAACELALKVSGAVQARRWTRTADGGGFIYSFNGPHSLFVDTVRSLRALGISHSLGHVLLEENDRRVSLLARLVQHASATARWSVYYGEGRDAYDVPGRVAHESIFNVNDGAYRCPNSQQGWSPFTTWTRGLAWAILGFAEELEYIGSRPDEELQPLGQDATFGGGQNATFGGGGKPAVIAMMRRAAQATSEFWLAHTASDGIPYWDTGAPGLDRLGDWRGRPAEPFNDFEPVDSSAAAIACQGLVRLGSWLRGSGASGATAAAGASAPADPAGADTASRADGERFLAAGLSLLGRLLEEPYLSTQEDHQGLLLHSVYHRPNGWDHVPAGRKVPCGESSMWGDYHLREAALHAQRLLGGGTPLMFWTGMSSTGMSSKGRKAQ